jgi:16S rRNA (guanine527-N7)-methyltransferase
MTDRPRRGPKNARGGAARPARKPAPRPQARPEPRDGPRPDRRPARVPKRVDVVVAPASTPIAPPDDFVARASAIGVEFEPGDLDRLGKYLAELLNANEAVNLTAVKEPAEAWTRHILDSLTLMAPLADLPDGSMIIDVGSGGGLPGIPLAICCPQFSFTLLEATGKKAQFLRQVIQHLQISNARVLEARAETAAHDRGTRDHAGARSNGQRESYDAAIARAVGRLATLAELVVPFVKINGRALLIKGKAADEELTEATEALRMLNAVHIATLDTPTGRIVALEKRVATPKLYPRADGEPKRSPLGVGKARPPRQ